MTAGASAMTKSELIDRLAAQFPQLVAKDAELAVKMILDAMGESLGEGRAHRDPRVRQLRPQLPAAADRTQSEVRREGAGAAEIRAALQGRQGVARARRLCRRRTYVNSGVTCGRWRRLHRILRSRERRAASSDGIIAPMHIVRWIVGATVFLALLFLSLQNSEPASSSSSTVASLAGAARRRRVHRASRSGVAIGLLAGALRGVAPQAPDQRLAPRAAQPRIASPVTPRAAGARHRAASGPGFGRGDRLHDGL